MSEPGKPSEEDLKQLVEHLEGQEAAAREATLSNIDSFRAWVMEHPALQQPGIYEMLNQYGPALIEMVKRLIGL